MEYSELTKHFIWSITGFNSRRWSASLLNGRFQVIHDRLTGGNDETFYRDGLGIGLAAGKTAGYIAAAGFDGVEIFDNDLVYYPGSPAQIRDLCAELGLEILLFQPFRDLEGGPRESLAQNLSRAARKFDVMQQLGCSRMLLCSNVSPDSSEDMATQVSDLRALAELAAEYDITVGYDALAWGRHVNLWRDAWARVKAVDHPALGIILDTNGKTKRRFDNAGKGAGQGNKNDSR